MTTLVLDFSLDIRSHYRGTNGALRNEGGTEKMIVLPCGQPAWHRDIKRTATDGPIRFGKDTAPRILKKMVKCIVGTPFGRMVLANAGIALALESRFPTSTALHALYRLAIGVHLQRGVRG